MGKTVETRVATVTLRSNPETLQRFAEAINRGQLHRAYEILQESGSTSDFPILMGNGQNRVLQASYRAVPDLWRQICNVGTIKDFREKEIIRISEADDLEEIQELAETKDSSLSEAKETTKLAVYARRYTVSWKTVVNDDLDAIRRQPDRFGRSASRLLNKLAFQGILESNPTMSDGVPLFHANHGNLGSAALGETSLQAAFAAIGQQTDDKGNKIDLIVNKPKLVVPKNELEFTAKKLVNTTLVPATSIGGQILGDVNTLQGMAEVVAVPYLTDSNDWYLIIDPRDGDTIQMDFLRMIGENPQLFVKRNEWEFLGGGVAGMEQFDHEYMVRHVAAAKAVDWRGMYKGQVA